ncbi:MAG: hypothetical protein NTZ35_01955 [Ignavibacteriales bacterium]|nr:hypothetical protein [Ignavibacteriales bacterium]
MSTRRISISKLLTISFLMLVSAAVLLGQTQQQTKAKTKEETKAQTQAETKAGTQAQPKAGTQAQTKAAIREGKKADTLQPTQQAQKAIPKKIGKGQAQTIRAKSHSGQCQAITKDGTRCTRKALPGSKYCRQHDGK